jgi:outer membrane protein assembly factor BamB
MRRTVAVCALALLQLGAAPADIVGLWVGPARHEGQETQIGLRIEDAGEGRLRAVVGPASVEGDKVTAGPLALTLREGVLHGTLPDFLVPVYTVPLELKRTTAWSPARRPEPTAPVVSPTWSFDAGSGIWAGVTAAGGRVYAGTEKGMVHAVDAVTGRPVWSFPTGGAVRATPTAAGDAVYVHSDDGFVYRLGADGRLRWKVKVDPAPPERLPPGPNSRFDRWGSSVAAAGARLYVGTHDGRLLALDAAKGTTAWEFQAGDSVLAAPAVGNGLVVFGSYDGKVYALEETTGALRWSHDTRKPVVSTPALDRGRVVIGSRSYDLLGLDAATGVPAWKKYLWFSWIESSAVVRDGTAYVGSSDAGKIFAVDVRAGKPAWETDVYGWPWATPAVTATHVYAATNGDPRNPAPYRAGVLALDRRSGRITWWHPLPATTEPGVDGIPGPVAAANGHVYVGTLDGRVLGFKEPSP